MRFRRVLDVAAIALGLFTAAATCFASPDELYYSATNCKPFNASSFHGSGATGFAFNPPQGGWFNYASGSRALVCPVPYRRDTGNLERVTVRIRIQDYHPSRFTQAFLCGRSGTGGKSCDSATDFPNQLGSTFIELSLQPTAAMRYFWIEVVVPGDAEDNNPFSLNGTSGVIGYRVFRN